MELQYRKNDKTGEELYYTTHSSGLGIYIIPKKDVYKRQKLNNAEETKKVSDAIANADFVIEKVKRGQQKRNPQPPFTTSTLQQDASRKYNFQAAKTMQIAQTLYEGIRCV